MKKLRQLVSLTLCLAALMSTTVTYAANTTATFTDVPTTHWASSYIEQCASKGLVSGVGDSKFDPDGKVTCAQFIVMTMKAFYPSTPGHVEGGKWYTTYMTAAQNKAILLYVPSGNSDEGANTPLTRAEMAQICYNVLVQKNKSPTFNETQAAEKKITDFDQIPYSHQTAVAACYAKNIISGMSDGTFDGTSNMTRAQACVVLSRLDSLVNSGTAPVEPVTPTQPSNTPGDLTVRTSSKILTLNGIPLCGLMEINGEVYVPLRIGTSAPLGHFISYGNSNYSKEWIIGFTSGTQYITIPDCSVFPPQGQVVGTAQFSRMAKIPKMGNIFNQVNTREIAVYTLDGQFPMAKLSEIFEGAVSDQGNILSVTLPELNVSRVKLEGDLVGSVMPPLVRSTPKETVKAIHDYVVNTLTYYFWEDDTAYAAKENASQKYSWHNNQTLTSGYGKCQGYSELFLEMCLRAGIPCEFVSGDATGGGDPSHTWNRVYVDGKWSYVDCTWDDPVGKKPTLLYDYFLVDAETMAKDHCWKGDDYPMPAEYDPAWELLDPNNITSADMYRKCLVAQVMQKKTSFSLHPTASGAYGGNACLYAYKGLHWESMGGGYNSKTKSYDYKVEY